MLLLHWHFLGSRVPRLHNFGFKLPGFGFRVPGSGFQIPDFGFRVPGFGFLILSLGFRVEGPAHMDGDWPHLTVGVYKVVLQQSIPAQIRQLILYISNNKGLVDGFVLELTCAKRLDKHFRWDKNVSKGARPLVKTFSFVISYRFFESPRFVPQVAGFWRAPAQIKGLKMAIWWWEWPCRNGRGLRFLPRSDRDIRSSPLLDHISL